MAGKPDLTAVDDANPPPPRRRKRLPRELEDLGKRGRAFYREVTDFYDLNMDELQLLAEACRTLDDCDRLREQIDADGYMVAGSTGQKRLHPAVMELRQTRSALGKFLAQLGLPNPDDDQPALTSPTTRRARNAANARWTQRDYQRQQREERARRGTHP